MDLVTLSRLQFASTTVYHFFFVPLTIGLAWFLVLFEGIYVHTGNPLYKRLTKFWGKLFLINFAMGVVTGIVLEFQFGMNWSEYSRFVGDIFGAPLALEALLTFFLESTFLGVWVFGWERLSKRMHFASIVLVAFGSTMSAFWILVANGFMQQPVGYALVDGRAQMTDFFALILNPRAWHFLFHTITSAVTTASFFVLAVSAWQLVRKTKETAFRTSMRIAGVAAVLSTFGVILSGHMQAVHVREVQPMAAAASEALMDTADPAAFSVIAGFDETGKDVVWSLDIPYALSLLYYLQPSGEVQGIRQLQGEYTALYGPGDYVPWVALDYWTFRIMVGAGFAMFGIAAVAVFLDWKKWPAWSTRFLPLLAWVFLLPYLANTTGWILTENGRQPWIVHGLLRTEDAVSPNIPVEMVWLSLAGFATVYLALIIVDIFLLVRMARLGLEPDPAGSAE